MAAEMAVQMVAEMAATLLPTHIYCYICHQKVNKHYVYMYTNVKQHCYCQSQDNFSTLNITLISENEFFHEIQCNGMTSFMEFM